MSIDAMAKVIVAIGVGGRTGLGLSEQGNLEGVLLRTLGKSPNKRIMRARSRK